MAKNSGSIFEIRPGVYAYGSPGQRATAVRKAKDGSGWEGIRGVKPLISLGAKNANPPQAAIDKLNELAGR